MLKLTLFDFDGTIADSFSGYFDFYNSLCREYGIKTLWTDKEEFREWVSGNWRDNVHKLGLDDEVEETNAQFRKYRQNNPIQLQKGIIQAVTPHRDYRQGILSAENADYINNFLRENDLEMNFEGVFGADTLTYPKPNPLALKEARDKFNTSPNETVYVGDTVEDVEFARADGSRIIAVSYGWNPKSKLEKANPDYLVNSPQELQDILREL